MMKHARSFLILALLMAVTLVLTCTAAAAETREDVRIDGALGSFTAS